MYIYHLLSLMGIFSIVTIGANVIVGYSGLVSLAQAALFGVGAYSVAILTANEGVSFSTALLAAILLPGVLSGLIALLSLRMGGDYFVIATLGVQFVLWSVFNNWREMTGGPMGVAGIPPIELFGFDAPVGHMLFIILWATLCFILVLALARSPWGRVVKAIGADERYTRSLGKNTLLYKVTAFMLAGGMAGLAGALYGPYLSFIDPASFTITESIFILSIVIIGGAGSLWGPVVGAVVLVALPELLRFTGFPETMSANLRQILYGLLLVLILIYRPQGMAGRYAFGRV